MSGSLTCGRGWHALPAGIMRSGCALAAAGAFPSPAKARVLCAHIHGDPQAMSDLRRLAESVAAAAPARRGTAARRGAGATGRT